MRLWQVKQPRHSYTTTTIRHFETSHIPHFHISCSISIKYLLSIYPLIVFPKIYAEDDAGRFIGPSSAPNDIAVGESMHTHFFFLNPKTFRFTEDFISILWFLLLLLLFFCNSTRDGKVLFAVAYPSWCCSRGIELTGSSSEFA